MRGTAGLKMEKLNFCAFSAPNTIAQSRSAIVCFNVDARACHDLHSERQASYSIQNSAGPHLSLK